MSIRIQFLKDSNFFTKTELVAEDTGPNAIFTIS